MLRQLLSHGMIGSGGRAGSRNERMLIRSIREHEGESQVILEREEKSNENKGAKIKQILKRVAYHKSDGLSDKQNKLFSPSSSLGGEGL